VKKELVASNIIIQGVKEGEKETYVDLEKQVEKVLGALKIGDIDYSSIRRLGRPTTGKARSIQVKLVRQKDKVRILVAKKNLKGLEGFNKIYINPELTNLEKEREKALREAGRDLKKEKKNLKYFIKGGRLTTIENGEEKQYGLDAWGNVDEIRR
jgi:hypothetical protein